MDFKCRECQKPFTRSPSRAKHGRGRTCSRKCQYRSNRKTLARPDGIVWKQCIGCDFPFPVRKAWLKGRKGGGKYCTRSCRDKNRTKENHPQYMNGRSSEKRGPNWQAQKRKAMARDKRRCRRCGDKAVAVHHVIPFRVFGITRYLEANRLSNLRSLCGRCHRKADALLQSRRFSGR